MVCEALQAQTDNLQQGILFSPVDGEGGPVEDGAEKGQLSRRLLSLAATVPTMMERFGTGLSTGTCHEGGIGIVRMMVALSE